MYSINLQAYHTSAEVLNALGNVLVQYLVGDDTYTITTSNHPLPNSATTQVRHKSSVFVTKSTFEGTLQLLHVL